MTAPRLQAIFQRQIPGGRTLLALAARRFAEAGLGAEIYPESPDDLRDTLPFLPSPSHGYTAHLPRNINLLDPDARARVCAFAAASGADAVGLVVHDQIEVATRFEEYVAAVRELEARLPREGGRPLVLIEYAAWLEPATFLALHEELGDLAGIGACIDIGHVGLFHYEKALRRTHPELSVWQMKSHTPELRSNVESVQAACRSALPGVLAMIDAFGRIGKPLHFHLHDGHPSSTFSSAGVSDHLSFFQEIPIPFAYRGSYTLPTLFGPLGLQRVVAAARSALPDDLLSFTLEIHAPQGRQPLGEYAPLFAQWQDLRDAERMQYWIEVLLRNHRLLAAACGRGDAGASGDI